MIVLFIKEKRTEERVLRRKDIYILNTIVLLFSIVSLELNFPDMITKYSRYIFIVCCFIIVTKYWFEK